MGIIKVERIDLEGKDIPPGWEPQQEEVNCIACCPDFSDKAWHFRGYVVIEHKSWMDMRPDIYVKQENGNIHLRQSFVHPNDWRQMEQQAWYEHIRRRRV